MVSGRKNSPFYLFFALFFSFMLCFDSSAIARLEVSHNRASLVTTHIADDFDASVSGDGKSLVFTSTRTGNRDLWLKYTDPKKGFESIRITKNYAADFSPSLSRDGREVVFVSNRTDSKGDIYILKLGLSGAVSEPYRLTGNTTIDKDPVFSPDAKKVAYTSSIPGEKPQIWLYDRTTRKSFALTEGGGFSPSFSPDGEVLAFIRQSASAKNMREGVCLLRLSDRRLIKLASYGNGYIRSRSHSREAFPVFAKNGKDIYLSSFDEDTDKDGQITLRDTPNIWKISLLALDWKNGKATVLRRRMGKDYALFPEDAGEFIYFTAKRHGKLDIQKISSAGEFSFSGSLDDVYRSLNKNHTLSRLKKTQKKLLLQNIIEDYYGQKSNRHYVETVLSLADVYIADDEYLGAEEILRKVLGDFAEPSPYYYYAKLGIFNILLKEGRNGLEEQAASLLNAVEDVRVKDSVRAKILVKIAEFYKKKQEINKAAESLDKVGSLCPACTDTQAEALYKKAELYSLFSSEQEKLINTYSSLLRLYPGSVPWAEKAYKRVLSLATSSPGDDEKLRALWQVVSKNKDLPLLPAAALIESGKIFMKRGKPQSAKKEFSRVITDFSENTVLKAKAELLLAEVYYSEGNLEASLEAYKPLLALHAAPSLWAYYQKAKKGFIEKSLQKANKEIKENDPRLAIKTYRALIEFDESVIEAHRGLVRLYVSLKEASKAVNYYKAKLKEKPASGPYHYALGLALTYVDDLKAAEEEILYALSIDFEKSYYHQTLGWVFEQLDRNGDGDYLNKALAEYQTALTYTRIQSRGYADADLEGNEASLLLNIANCYYTLKNYKWALRFYSQREKLGFSGKYPREFVYYLRYADSCFREDLFKLAEEKYLLSLEYLKEAGEKKYSAMIYEKLGMVSGEARNYKKAVKYYTEAVIRNKKEKDSKNLPRNLRNLAYSIYKMQEGKNLDRELLKKALLLFEKSLKALDSASVEEKGTALLSLNLPVSKQGGAAIGFSPSKEKQLIFTFIGQIYKKAGYHRGALSALEHKLSLIPRDNLSVKEHPASLTEVAVLLNQIGLEKFLLGRYKDAVGDMWESYRLCGDLLSLSGRAINMANIAYIENIAGAGGESSLIIIPLMKKLISDMQKREKLFMPAIQLALHKNIAALSFRLGSEGHGGGDVFEIGKCGEPNSLDCKSYLGSIWFTHPWWKEALEAYSSGLELIKLFDKKNRGPFYIEDLEFTLNISEIYRKLGRKQKAAYWQKLAGEKLIKLHEPQLAFLPGSSVRDLGVLENAFKALVSSTLISYRGAGFRDWQRIELQRVTRLLVNLLLRYAKTDRVLEVLEQEREALFFLDNPDVPTTNTDIAEFQKAAADIRTLKGDLLTLYDSKTRTSKENKLKNLKDYWLEMRSSITPLTPDITSVKAALNTRDAFLVVHVIAGKICVWDLSKTPTSFSTYRLGEVDGLKKLDGGTLKPDTPLLRYIEESCQGKARLYLVLSEELYPLPWELVMTREGLLGKKIIFERSISQWLLAYSNRNVFLPRAISFDALVDGTPYFDREPLTRDNFLLKEQRYPMVISTFTLPGRDGEAMSVRFGGEPEGMDTMPFAVWPVRSVPGYLLFCSGEPRRGLEVLKGARVQAQRGYSSVIFSFGAKKNLKHKKEFVTLFLKRLGKLSAHEAFSYAGDEFFRRYSCFPPFRFFGYGGMEASEQAVFAKKNLRRSARKAAVFIKKKKWEEAVQPIAEVLAMMDVLGLRRGREALLQKMSTVYFNLSEYVKAIEFEKKRIKTINSAKDPDQEKLAEAYYYLGILYSRNEEYKKATDYIGRAIAIYKSYDILDKLAKNYSELGKVLEGSLNYKDALKSFQSSFAVSSQLGENNLMADQLRKIGRIYYLRLNDYKKAFTEFNKAIKLYSKTGDKKAMLRAIFEVGLVNEKRGDYKKAKKEFKRGIQLAEEIDDKEGISLGYAYMANASWLVSEYQECFSYANKAYKIAKKNNYKRIRMIVENLRGLLYWSLNKTKIAIMHLERSERLAAELGSEIDMASTYNNIGLIYRKEGKLKAAISEMKKALAIDKKLGSKWGRAYDMRNIGISYIAMKAYDKAVHYLKSASDISSEIGDRTNLAKTFLALADLYRYTEKVDKAIEFYNKAEKLSKETFIPEVTWRALRGAGMMYRNRDRAKAKEKYMEAVELVEGMRAGIKIEELKNGFIEDKQDLYQEIVLLLLDSGNVKEAFNYSERARGRSFIDILGNKVLKLKNSDTQKAYDALLTIKKDLASLRQDIASAAPEDKSLLLTALREKKLELKEALINIKEKEPQLSSFVTVAYLDADAVFDMLESDVALLEYMVTKNEVVAWVLKNKKINFVRIPIERLSLDGKIKAFRELIQNMEPLRLESRELYRLLLGPLQRYIDGAKHLCIVPYGALHYLSFSALMGPDDVYFSDRHMLFFSPSASVLSYTLKPLNKRGRIGKVLAIGNPDLGSYNYDLPLAELEAESIRWDFPSVDVIMRKDATESWIKNNLSKYDVIHFASHGEFDSINPLLSSIKLAKDSKEDGSFNVSEVFSTKINARLVTLSACQTGLSKIQGGEELVGLNRAFIYAGTRSILSTLWRVSDLSTSILIKHFYRNLGKLSLAGSLQKAQAQVRKYFPHPAYWAALTLTGNYK